MPICTISISDLKTRPRARCVCKVKVFSSTLVYTSFPLFDMQHNHIQKKIFWPFDPTPGVEGVCKDRICAYMVFYAPFPLI